MTDEQRARTLLRQAAELPDLGPAPVERIVGAGRRRRARYRIATAAAAAVAVAVAIAIPAAFGGAATPRTMPPRHHASSAASAAGLARGRWTQLPDSPLAGRELGNFGAVWTGHELLVAGYGGFANTVAGAAYVPGAGWHQIAPIPDGLGTTFRDILWAGTDLVVLHRGSRSLPGWPGAVAAIYVPGANAWTVTAFPLPSTGTDLNLLTAASLGDEVVFAEVVSGKLDAYSYSLSARSWRQLAVSLPPAHKVTQLTMVTAGDKVILWSAWDDGPPAGSGRPRTSGADIRIMKASGNWQPGSLPPAVQSYTPVSAAGGQIFLLPAPPGGQARNRAYLINAASLMASPVELAPAAPRVSGLPARGYAPGLWTGAAVLAFAPDYGVNNGPEIFHDYMTALDPATGRWYRLPSGPPGSSVAWPLAPVWAGHQMFVTNGSVLWSFGR